MSSEVLSALSSLVAELSAEERAALAEMIRAEPERVAIIGMGGRFPGATDPEAFWRVLRDGTDCIREVPAQRWDIDAWYDPDPDAPGKMYSRWGGFLDGVDQFDAAFFELSPREAESMDPQQRLLLEVTWEALEDAGQIPSRLEGTRTGVYVGMCNVDYGKLVVSEDLTRTDLYTGSGNLRSVASGRISYLLGLQGPSITLDTACSSSLLAIHLAAESLRSGECSLALAGGVNLVLHPEYHVYLSRTRMMARDGRCKAFDARADGFVRSEGCGVVVLKRLSEALRDGDRILGVLRGTAANNDGRSSGLTAPNMIAQQAVLREALRNAGLSASDITHLETHGTGTALGDPIEFEALREVLGDPREDGSTCALGAAKTNLGHLEAAAGVVGLIKILLSMRHEAIPALVHFRKLNPRLSLEGTPFVIPTQLTPWPRGSKRRIAGVSSFGMSGTNVHVIVEEPSVRPVRAVAVSSTRPHLLVLSARTPEALRALAQTFREHLEALEQRPDMSLEDVLFSAAGRREHYEHRLAAVGTSAAELSAALGAHVRGSSHSGLVLGTVPQRGERPRVVFVFPGQGSQWVGMGRELLESEPVFRQALEACDAAIRPYTGVSVVEGLRAGSAELLERIDLIQPTLFALEVALAEQWRAWGVEPDAVVGHSMGEVAAACVAGALSLEDAARVICVRSRLLRKVSG
ncbi:type I polyketide synthase, partial [Hyalangium sp.]|uniref:type I polyketide synthase n=1 Tax=Hyalangium sp. TaxID=2028555 RepID=UPI002D506185